ncbi:hypothetical protein Tco_0260218 [Tanacetum coccineum]
MKKTLLKSWLIDYFQDDLVKDPRERSFDDYKWMFDLEVYQLADEYELGIEKKGHMLDDIWENCKKVQGDKLMDALPLGRENGSRFKDMICKEVDSGRRINRKTFYLKGGEIQGIPRLVFRVFKVLYGRNHIGYAVTDIIMV